MEALKRGSTEVKRGRCASGLLNAKQALHAMVNFGSFEAAGSEKLHDDLTTCLGMIWCSWTWQTAFFRRKNTRHSGLYFKNQSSDSFLVNSIFHYLIYIETGTEAQARSRSRLHLQNGKPTEPSTPKTTKSILPWILYPVSPNPLIPSKIPTRPSPRQHLPRQAPPDSTLRPPRRSLPVERVPYPLNKVLPLVLSIQLYHNPGR